MIRDRLPAPIQRLFNIRMFKRYFESGRGILIEKGKDDDWDIDPVDAWDEASEAERRNER